MARDKDLRALSLSVAVVLATMIFTVPLTQMAAASPDTPAHTAVPSPILQGDSVTLTIANPPGGIFGGLLSVGEEMDVHDPGGAPVSLTTPLTADHPCSLEPAFKPTETRWGLVFDSDGAKVAYEVDPGEAFSMPFGGAGIFDVTVLSGSPSIGTTVAASGGFTARLITADVKWVALPGSATSAADNTIRPGTYTFDSCGNEDNSAPAGIQEETDGNYVGSATFDVQRRTGGEISPVSTTTLMIAATATNAFWLLPMLAAIGAAVGIFGLRRRQA